jgi:hypothetical protein
MQLAAAYRETDLSQGLSLEEAACSWLSCLDFAGNLVDVSNQIIDAMSSGGSDNGANSDTSDDSDIYDNDDDDDDDDDDGGDYDDAFNEKFDISGAISKVKGIISKVRGDVRLNSPLR